MKYLASVALSLCVLSLTIAGQTNWPISSSPNGKVTVTNTIPPAQPIKKTAPIISDGVPAQTPVTVARPAYVSPTPNVGSPVVAGRSNVDYDGLPFSAVKSRIAEARRQMQSRPMNTASVESTDAATDANQTLVRVAYQDAQTRKIEFVVISRDAFLTPLTPTSALSTSGKMVTLRTIRANGVNTPITVSDENGRPHLPLIIQYPVIRNGRFIETAYYVSTHPGLLSPDVINAGKFYVRNTIDLARQKLKDAGYAVQPRVADMAERLATVEHVDHFRFRTEPSANIFNDIFTLYALNEGQTYRYSISSAGAGGMVQMIPSTYKMVRDRHPMAGLMPDFVSGMQNHVNAAKAMLLYMQMTWNDLVASPTVSGALSSGIATPEQLMAAGYNSNPARLAGYINRGGAAWTSLIPRETKVYLQIYSALETAVPEQHRSR